MCQQFEDRERDILVNVTSLSAEYFISVKVACVGACRMVKDHKGIEDKYVAENDHQWRIMEDHAFARCAQ